MYVGNAYARGVQTTDKDEEKANKERAEGEGVCKVCVVLTKMQMMVRAGGWMDNARPMYFSGGDANQRKKQTISLDGRYKKRGKAATKQDETASLTAR